MAKLFTSPPSAWSSNSSHAFPRERSDSPPSIKCSDCGLEVTLTDLGAHICTSAPSKPPSSRTVGQQPNPKPTSPLLSASSAFDGIKYRAKAAGLRIATSTGLDTLDAPKSAVSLRSPLGSSASTTPSGGLSPGPQLERSASANSSASDAPASPNSANPSLPFFNKYNRMYGAAGFQTSPASATSSSFAQRSPSLNCSQPGSANYSSEFTTSSSQSSLAGSSFAPRNSTSSRCTSPEPLSSLYDGVDDIEVEEPSFKRQPFHNLSNLPEIAHIPSKQSRAADAGQSGNLTKYPQPYFAHSFSEPASISELANQHEKGRKPPAARPVPPRSTSTNAGRGLAQLDNLLEGFDLEQDHGPSDSRPPRTSSQAHARKPSDDDDFAATYYLNSSPDEKKTPRSSASKTSSSHTESKRMGTEPKTVRCASCRRSVPRDTARSAQEDNRSAFCSTCYSKLYLPKCRKCTFAIEGKAIGDGKGKVKGKFHPGCFTCFECSEAFPTGEFYVFDEEPYCFKHYHHLNGSTCVNCQDGIEGPCVSLPAAGSSQPPLRYHAPCFKCSHPRCSIVLAEFHFVVNHLPFCEDHAVQRSGATSPNNKPEKRKTLIQPIKPRR